MKGYIWNKQQPHFKIFQSPGQVIGIAKHSKICLAAYLLLSIVNKLVPDVPGKYPALRGHPASRLIERG
jgi:hypothetical protein